jgi:phage baseplate assembly protein W
MNVAYPYQVDAQGRTASASDDQHIRDLIEQVLFTVPGERVMRPDFGSNLSQLVFAPSSPELAGATHMLVQSALQRWLADIIVVDSVTIEATEAALTVRVLYRKVMSDETLDQTFVHPGAAP